MTASKVLVKLLQKLAGCRGSALTKNTFSVRSTVVFKRLALEQIFLTSVEIFLAQVQGIFGDGGKGLPKRTNVGAVQRAFFWFFFCAYRSQKKNQAIVFLSLHGCWSTSLSRFFFDCHRRKRKSLAKRNARSEGKAYFTTVKSPVPIAPQRLCLWKPQTFEKVWSKLCYRRRCQAVPINSLSNIF